MSTHSYSSPGMTISYFCHDTKRGGGVIMTLIGMEVSPYEYSIMTYRDMYRGELSLSPLYFAISLDSRFDDLESTGLSTTLKC